MLTANFQKRLGSFTLNVSIEARQETLGLLGASGCGKSMALKCIAGIETPDAGRIVLDNRILFDSQQKINLTPQARRVGYLFQQPSLFPNMTVAQNIAAGVRNKEPSARQTIVEDKISAMHLAGLGNRRPAELSGGQQQRAAIARMLASEPELLLLDEPFSALDDHLRWQLELELDDTLAALGKPAIFVSHSQDEVYRLCDSVCVLSHGRSQPKRSVQDLFKKPQTLDASLLSGCKNHSRVRLIDDWHVEALDWGVSLIHNGGRAIPPKWIGVRAQTICLADGPGENRMYCRVERVIDNLSSTIVMVRPENTAHGRSRIRIELDPVLWEAQGDPGFLYIHIRPQDILLLDNC